MKDETYDYCNAEECPYMANGDLEDHVIELDEIPDYPQELSLAYDNHCDYKCTCCVARKNDPFDPEVEKKIEQEIRVALPHIKCCTGNGQGEFFVSPSTMRVVSEWEPEKIENATFSLESNGSLFTPECAMDENIEWFFDVRNPLHPYHQEYLEMMKAPILKDPRVFVWTGDNLSKRGELPARANYRVLKDLFFIENIGKKLSDYFIEHGYKKIVLYALTDITNALIKVLEGQEVEIEYIYDRNSKLTEWQGYEVRKPQNHSLTATDSPILVTLIARHGEMEEFLRKHEYAGDILCLDKILETFRCCK